MEPFSAPNTPLPPPAWPDAPESELPGGALEEGELVATVAAAGEPAPVNEDDPVSNLLAQFFHKGYVNRREAKLLINPAHREEAERRLRGVGLTLAWSPYSRYYGVALADGPGDRAERITNLAELDRNALALLVILWARLVLPQRLAEEGREGGVAEPVVSFDALNAEFGKKLGGRRFEMYISQLRRLGFLEYTRKDEIKAGPFLDLLGDSHRLASYLHQSTLARLVKEQPAASEDAGGDDPDAAAEADWRVTHTADAPADEAAAEEEA